MQQNIAFAAGQLHTQLQLPSPFAAGMRSQYQQCVESDICWYLGLRDIEYEKRHLYHRNTQSDDEGHALCACVFACKLSRKKVFGEKENNPNLRATVPSTPSPIKTTNSD